jgi:hypothetical protein
MEPPGGQKRTFSGMRILGGMAALGLILAVSAWAKDIRPGELRICGQKHCHAVKDPAQARGFADLLWGQSRIARATTPSTGSPVFQLRFQDGPVGAIITATAIRVHGLNCGRFQRGKWYRLPARLRGLTRGLQPRSLSARVPHSC